MSSKFSLFIELGVEVIHNYTSIIACHTSRILIGGIMAKV
jgi:hypothetical protein